MGILKSETIQSAALLFTDGCKARDECLQLRFVEAVQKEMSGEDIGGIFGRSPLEDVLLLEGNTAQGVGLSGYGPALVEHGRAAVDAEKLRGVIRRERRLEKAARAFSEGKDVARFMNGIEMRGAATLHERARKTFFHPDVKARQTVEAGRFGGRLQGNLRSCSWDDISAYLH